MENGDFVDQKVDRTYEAISRWILAHRELLSKQGTVVVSWRNYDGRRLGPFYRLAYRDGERQCSVYLGKSVELADQVRALLEECQAAVREQRAWQRIGEQARMGLKRHKDLWSQELAKVGLYLRGSEVRGWRALRRAGKSGLQTGPDHMPARR